MTYGARLAVSLLSSPFTLRVLGDALRRMVVLFFVTPLRPCALVVAQVTTYTVTACPLALMLPVLLRLH